MGLKSLWDFFLVCLCARVCVWGGGGEEWGGSVANIIGHGLLHTLGETMNPGNRKVIPTRQFQPLSDYNDLKKLLRSRL